VCIALTLFSIYNVINIVISTKYRIVQFETKPEPVLHSQYGDYALDDTGLIIRRRHKIVSSLQRPVILLGPHSFLSTGYRGIW